MDIHSQAARVAFFITAQCRRCSTAQHGRLTLCYSACQSANSPENAAEPVSHFIDRPDGVKVHYKAQGKDEKGAVILVHGFPEFWFSWRHVIPILSAAGYRVLAPDIRGHGQTEAPSIDAKYFTNDGCMSDFVAILDNEGLEKAHLVAMDWGCLPAQLAARLHEDRFHSLTLLAVPHFSYPKPLAAEMAAMADRWRYQLIMIKPETAANLEEDLQQTYRGIFQSIDTERGFGLPSDPDKGMWQNLTIDLPVYISKEECDAYVNNVKSYANVRGGKEAGAGFLPMLKWYHDDVRTLDNEFMKASGVKNEYHIPIFMITAERDASCTPEISAGMVEFTRAGFRRAHCTRAGHWIPACQPHWLTGELIPFFKAVSAGEYKNANGTK